MGRFTKLFWMWLGISIFCFAYFFTYSFLTQKPTVFFESSPEKHVVLRVNPKDYSTTELEQLADIAFEWVHKEKSETFMSNFEQTLEQSFDDLILENIASFNVEPYYLSEEHGLISLDGPRLAQMKLKSAMALAEQDLFSTYGSSEIMHLYAVCTKPTDHMNTCQPYDKLTNLELEPLVTLP